MKLTLDKTTIITASAALLIGLGVGLSISLLGSDPVPEQPALAKPAKKAFINKHEKKLIDTGIANMKKLPDHIKAALIASRYGLLYIPGRISAYSVNDNYSPEEKVQYYPVLGNSQYVGLDGNMYKFYDVIRDRNTNKELTDAWVTVMQCIGGTSDEAIFSEFTDDITALAQKAAQNHLSTLSNDERNAWLAAKSHFLFAGANEDIYTGRLVRERVPGTNIECTTHEATNEAKYMTPDGKEQNFNQIYRRIRGNNRTSIAWQYASYCAAIVGAKPILALYPEQVKAMRKAYRAATK